MSSVIRVFCVVNASDYDDTSRRILHRQYLSSFRCSQLFDDQRFLSADANATTKRGDGNHHFVFLK